MRIGYTLRNARDVARAAGMQRVLAARERWPRERLAAFQQARLADLVSFASTHSAFYRRLYGGPLAAADVRPETLPTVTKTAMMDAFDECVTDPRLRRSEVEHHLTELGSADELYLGAYRVMASSGSSGRKGLYVYDRAAWSALLAGGMRWMGWMGVTPRLPRRRIAQIAAPDAKHMTVRGAASVDLGLMRSLRLAASAPLAELVAALNAHRPEAVTGYPSMLALLAQEQCAGRLRITPRVVATTSELRTPEMAARIREAWGVDPFDCYAMTETGIVATNCPEERAMHLFDDCTIVEVVDEHDRPVPPGARGAKVLVTNLTNRVQPFIRFEVSDLLTVSDEPCPCGRGFRRLAAVEGRADDVLAMPGATGGLVIVHPIHLRSPLAAIAAVAQYQIVQESDGLDVAVVPADATAAASLATTVRDALEAKLRTIGVAVAVRVRVVPGLAREEGAGKLKLVRSNVTRTAAA